MVRVMVVDDHPMWREGVARDLAEAGHDVVATAGDGAAAVRIAAAARPEVVLMDLQLPVGSGVTATGEILAVAQNAAADADGPTATTGLYPPGSTFKIITAGAAIDRDMATPNTLLGCPGHIDIGQRTIPNYGGFDLGTVLGA